MTTAKTCRNAAFVALGIAAAILLGLMTRQDLDAEQKEYCDNVREQTWPDYKGTYAEVCGEVPPAPPTLQPQRMKNIERIVLTL